MKRQEEAAKAARQKVFDKETKSIIPKWATNAWDWVSASPGRKKWVTALGAKTPYRLLVKNSEWYREGVERPIQDQLPKEP